MTKTKRIQILCLLGAVTLLLSGCWTEAPVESANGLLGDQEPADQQEEVILPAAFTLPYDPDQTLDPVTCADGMQQVAGSLIYEGLFRLDRQLEPQPWLCQSYTYDAASLTYTFTLRSGVTFSDGSPLTAADAAATLRAGQEFPAVQRPAGPCGRCLRRRRGGNRNPVPPGLQPPGPAGHPHRQVRNRGKPHPCGHRPLLFHHR